MTEQSAAHPDRPLAGRRALITGGNRGFGRAIAEAYVRAGASVLLTARDAHALAETAAALESIRSADQMIRTFAADIAVPGDGDRSVEQLAALPDGPTILVNNAGVYGPIGLIEDVDMDAWEDALRVNLFGTVRMVRAIAPMLRASGYGKIVNLSGGGATAPMPRFSAYAASKAAVVRLTETFAHELLDARVDVNAVAPGALNTRLLDEVLSAGPAAAGVGVYAKALKQQEEGGAPLGTGAALCVYLASAESDGITGRLISAIWDDWKSLADKREALAGSDVYTLRRIVPKDRNLAW